MTLKAPKAPITRRELVRFAQIGRAKVIQSLSRSQEMPMILISLVPEKRGWRIDVSGYCMRSARTLRAVRAAAEMIFDKDLRGKKGKC